MATTKNTTYTQKSEVSPHQDPGRMREAQELLHQLQKLLIEGETPDTNILSDALKKAEQITSQSANQSHMDEETRKALEDISNLLDSARKLGKNKQVDERLKKIYEESRKALESTRRSDVSDVQKEATRNVLEMVDTWRPLFYVLMSSRDFRQVLLDLVRITRNVVYGYTDDIQYEVEERFVEGVPAKDIADRTKSQFEQKGAPELSEEEWNRVQDDLQRVFSILSREPEYQRGIERLFTLFDLFKKTMLKADVNEETVVSPKSHENVHVRKVVSETEKLITSFSGKDTFEDFKYHLKNVIRKFQKNEKMRSYLRELKEFILKTKSEKEVQSEEFKRKLREITQRGRELTNEFREDDLKPLLQSTNDMIDNIKNDEMVSILREHAGVVQSDISYVDSQGNTKLDTDMMSKLQKVLLPVLAETLKYIPIPRIESSNADRDYWLDNIVLCGYDIIPDNIKFHLETDSEVSLRDIETKHSYTNLVIKLDHLLTELKDVEFYYNKKKFPTFEERGKATFRITGDGAKLTFRFKLVQGPSDVGMRVDKGYADFTISDMDIVFDKNSLKHDVLVPALSSMFSTTIRRQIEKQVEDNLTSFIERFGSQINNAFSEYKTPMRERIDLAMKTLKPVAQVVEKRKEALE